ncbi:hypothetical protein BKA83DRAFT_4122838 [Pisolithus microcarpus]|nr:hypothetical protein BKA83DRAFT_4122838 [Pisolithus microcarpus]
MPNSQIVSIADLQYPQSPQITHQIFSEASDYQTVRTTHPQNRSDDEAVRAPDPQILSEVSDHQTTVRIAESQIFSGVSDHQTASDTDYFGYFQKSQVLSGKSDHQAVRAADLTSAKPWVWYRGTDPVTDGTDFPQTKYRPVQTLQTYRPIDVIIHLPISCPKKEILLSRSKSAPMCYGNFNQSLKFPLLFFDTPGLQQNFANISPKKGDVAKIFRLLVGVYINLLTPAAQLFPLPPPSPLVVIVIPPSGDPPPNPHEVVPT